MSESDSAVAGAGLSNVPERWSPLRALLACLAFATAGIATWLGFVVAVVLPARDPAHVPMWTALAIGFLVYAVLTLLFVWRGPRPGLLPAAVVVLSLGATAFGFYATGSMVAAAGSTTRHFEGYLLVMGVVLAGHGLCALTYAALMAAISRRI